MKKSIILLLIGALFALLSLHVATALGGVNGCEIIIDPKDSQVFSFDASCLGNPQEAAQQAMDKAQCRLDNDRDNGDIVIDPADIQAQ